MNYQVSRNGQMYGPYTLEDLQRYLASGNVLPTDLCKSEEMADWVPVSQVIGQAGGAAAPTQATGFGTSYAAPAASFSTPGYADPSYPMQPNPASALATSQYPDAPNLHWGLVMLFSILTCGYFMMIWNLIVNAWLKRVQPNSTALFFYIGYAVLDIILLVQSISHGGHRAYMGNPYAGNNVGGLLWLLIRVVKLVARFMERSSLEEHFNGPEPVGLQLNPVMTFFFGGLYFQSQLNKINLMKQAARMGMGRGY